jgi:hypothetical protein
MEGNSFAIFGNSISFLMCELRDWGLDRFLRGRLWGKMYRRIALGKRQIQGSLHYPFDYAQGPV